MKRYVSAHLFSKLTGTTYERVIYAMQHEMVETIRIGRQMFIVRPKGVA